MVVRKALAWVHGGYYLGTGIAPFLSRRWFERVTGRKQEWWLVQCVGLLVTSIGMALVAAARRPEGPAKGDRAMALVAATGLAGIDAVYAVRGRISRVYLVDAAIDAALAAGWAASLAGSE